MNTQLKLTYLDKSKLVKLSENPRRIIDPDAKSKLQKLIKAHGFQNPLQVFKEKGERYTILCGNHRYDAGIGVGMNQFPCIVYKGTRNEAIARAISDNKSSEWTEWDIPILKEAFAELDTSKIDLSLSGFDKEEISFLENWAPHEESAPKSKATVEEYTISIGTVLQKDRDGVVDIIHKALINYEYEIKAV